MNASPSTPSSSRTPLIVGGVALALILCCACAVVIAAVGLFFVSDRQITFLATSTPNATAAPRATATPTPAPEPEEFEVPIEGFDHVPQGAEVSYEHYPPSSGVHYPRAAPWGVYTNPVPEGAFVHNLEHSGIVILYHCPEGCPELEQQLADFYDRVPPDPLFQEQKVLITPYERELPAYLVALAWGHQLNLYELDEERLLEFYQTYLNQGPEVIP
jgi:hypothetical protein